MLTPLRVIEKIVPEEKKTKLVYVCYKWNIYTEYVMFIVVVTTNNVVFQIEIQVAVQ